MEISGARADGSHSRYIWRCFYWKDKDKYSIIPAMQDCSFINKEEKMKKRFVVIACMLSGALALSLSACGSNGNDNAAQPSSTSEAEASDAEAVAQPETENETGGSAMSDGVNTGMANPWVESSRGDHGGART